MKKNYQKIILAMIFVLACAVRLYIHFSTDYIYWTNWAYYLVQVRSILENFSLWIPDMPLTFYIQAAVAKILEIFYSQSDAILYWVKIADSILPPLIIFPAFFLIKKLWEKKTETSNSLTNSSSLRATDFIGFLVAWVLAFWSPALSMIGDFQKNSLWLVWLMWVFYRVYLFLLSHNKKNLIWLMIAVGLMSLTHIWVLWVWLVYLAFIFLFYLIFEKSKAKKMLKLLLPLAIVLCIWGFFVAKEFDPSRIEKLLSVVYNWQNYINLNWIFSSNSMWGWPNQSSNSILGVLQNWSYWIISILAIVVASLQYKFKKISKEKFIFILWLALWTAAIGGPWVSGDSSNRFDLMAVLGASILWGYMLTSIRQKILQYLLVLVWTGILWYNFFTQWLKSHQLAVSTQTLQEIASLKNSISSPSESIVVTRHWAEWWSSRLLGTDIVQTQALTSDVWNSYKNVYYLNIAQTAGWMWWGWAPSWMWWPSWNNSFDWMKIFMLAGSVKNGWMWTPPTWNPWSWQTGWSWWNSTMKNVFESPTITWDMNTLYSGENITFAKVDSAPESLTGSTSSISWNISSSTNSTISN